jgi:hypothetical protein
MVALLVGSAYFSLLGLLPAALWYTENLPAPLAAWIGLTGILLLPMVVGRFLATVKPSNWTLVISADGLWLNLRSYQNYQLDQGKTVVFFPYRDITSASQHKAWRGTEMADRIVRWKEISLDLQLDVSNIATLQHEIADERVRRTTSTMLGGLITVSGRTNHVPIMLLDDGTLRIMWKSRYDFLRPRLSKVLAELSRYVKVSANGSPGRSSRHETVVWDSFTDEELDEHVLRSVETGDRLSAVKLLTVRGGYSLTEAKEFVDQLANAEHAHLS